ncbi:MAG: hypothetical protein AB1630_10010 [bacterium]
MRDKYLLWLVVFLFGIGIALFLQIFFLLEKPKISSERKKTDALLLENKELKKGMNRLLSERATYSTKIANLVEESKMKDEQIKMLVLRKPKEVVVFKPDIRIEEERQRLILENEHFAKINRELDKKIKEASDELLMKEDEKKSLEQGIKDKENEKNLVMAEMEEALLDTQSKEREEALEKDKIALSQKILSLQNEVAELSKQKEEISEKNALVLKEMDDLKEKLAITKEEKERIIESLNRKIEDTLKKKEEEVSKINAEKEEDKKRAHKRSLAGNFLSMFLLWKK